VEYQFDWKGDGTVLSTWGAANRSNSWTSPGTYFPRVRGRCTLHPSIVSFWSPTLTVRILPPPPAVDNLPFGFSDIPVPSATLSGVIQVGGWALDDVMVTKVELRSDMSFWPYIGDLYYTCGTRPDISVTYPNYPNNDCAGWGYMWLTNSMSATNDPQTGQPLEGTTHQFYLRVYDSAGQYADIGHRNITITNNTSQTPFGAMDVPSAGEIVSGPINVMGWALAKGKRRVTQALVRVDGVSLGQVNYGLNWPALAQVFPVSIYPYSENAAYAYSLDTTQFTNGQHALDVVAIDELGNLSGIGSRYIYIQN